MSVDNSLSSTIARSGNSDDFDALGREASEAPRHLTGEKGQRLYFIEVPTVDYVESEGNYVVLHVGEDRFIARNTIKHLARVLAPADFLRIERSLLVNLRRVDFAERSRGGGFVFTLKTGERLVSGSTYRQRILDEIRQGQIG